MVQYRLLPEDEYMHDTLGASNFNESMYFNFYDPKCSLGGFVRLGNRANEGYAEQTTCIYLPDGRVGFVFQRPEISNNERFAAGGCEFEIVEPFEDMRVRFEGKMVILERPEEMVEPRKAFKENPWVEASIDLRYRGLSPMYGGEPVDENGKPFDQKGNNFAKGHYEQHVGARGSVTVGDETWKVDSYGLRDHSWGPRNWSAPWWYRWLTGNCGDDFGFMISLIASRDGRKMRSGIIFADGEYKMVRDCRIKTEWQGNDIYHQTIAAVAKTDDREYSITGKVLNLIPLRHRRTTPEGEALLTRISEGMTEWQVEGVGTGYGLSEYLDQIIDGVPVGVSEEDGA
jgi:hypothetical protein